MPRPPCAECGDPNTEHGWCDKHRPQGYTKEQLWVLSGRRRREKAGVCYRCQRPALEGKRHCALHQRDVDNGLKQMNRLMARNIIIRAKQSAESRRDSESIFLDPDFVAKNPDLAGCMITEKSESEKEESK